MIRKITYTTLIFSCCSFFANAQIKEGAILVGGQASYSHTSEKNSNSNGIQKQDYGIIDLSVGKAIKENKVVGIHLEFAPGESHQTNNGSILYKAKSTGYGAGVFYRQYKTLTKDFYFFIEADVNYFYGKVTSVDSAGNKIQITKGSTVQLSLAPGISYKVLKNLHLEVTIPQIISTQYTVNKASGQTQFTSQNIVFSTNLNASTLNNLSVGFRLIF